MTNLVTCSADTAGVHWTFDTDSAQMSTDHYMFLFKFLKLQRAHVRNWIASYAVCEASCLFVQNLDAIRQKDLPDSPLNCDLSNTQMFVVCSLWTSFCNLHIAVCTRWDKKHVARTFAHIALAAVGAADFQNSVKLSALFLVIRFLTLSILPVH